MLPHTSSMHARHKQRPGQQPCCLSASLGPPQPRCAAAAHAAIQAASRQQAVRRPTPDRHCSPETKSPVPLQARQEATHAFTPGFVTHTHIQASTSSLATERVQMPTPHCCGSLGMKQHMRSLQAARCRNKQQACAGLSNRLVACLRVTAAAAGPMQSSACSHTGCALHEQTWSCAHT